MPNALPVPPSVHAVERWCVAIIRADRVTVEVLGDLFHTEQEAEFQASYLRKEWRGVTVQPAKCTVQVSLEGANHAGK
jgi:hypothetical protein